MNETLKLLNSIRDKFPLRFGFFLALFLSSVFYFSLLKNYEVSEQSAQAVFDVVAKYVFIFLVILVLLSFIFLIFAFWVFIFRQKKIKRYLQFSMSFADKSNEKTSSAVEIEAQKLLFPLFGSIKVRFNFNNNISSKKINIRGNKFSFFSTKNFKTKCYIDFYNVHNYVLQSVTFYFEDYFALFSVSSSINSNAQFYVLPQQTKIEHICVFPMAARENNVRSEVVKPISGEFMHFKNFESSDDVRRIVWKIFAKNKELVVRTQENRNPYASDVFLYACFYNNSTLLLQTKENSQTFLSYYKNVIWSVFSDLKKDKNMTFQLKLDQNINVESDDVLQTEMFEISAANWQNSLPANEFYKYGNVSLIFISSFSSKNDLEKLLQKANKSTVFVFVCLSKALKLNFLQATIKYMFVKPKDESIDRLKFKFLFSPLRKMMISNEKSIEEILNKGENQFYKI